MPIFSFGQSRTGAGRDRAHSHDPEAANKETPKREGEKKSESDGHAIKSSGCSAPCGSSELLA